MYFTDEESDEETLLKAQFWRPRGTSPQPQGTCPYYIAVNVIMLSHFVVTYFYSKNSLEKR